MRKAALDWVYKLAKKDKRVVFIGSDLGYKILEDFKEELPDQFFMEGIAEQNVIGMAAGMAMDGHIVYINTIAPFITRRCYEQLMLDVAMQNLPIRFIGSGGGVVYAPLGSTHLAFDDIALMRAIPNMSIVAPADADEMNRLMPLTLEWSGPMYIRLAKGYDPIVTPPDEDLEIGRAVTIREGGNILFVTYGITLKLAQAAADEYTAQTGKEVTILHYPTLKPFDRTNLLDYAVKVDTIVVIEEHIKSGSLGEMIACTLMENACNHLKYIHIAFPDKYLDDYGSQNDILQKYGITAENILNKIL